MPRYLIERTFPSGLGLQPDAAGEATCAKVVAHNAEDGVMWVHSYVSDDRSRTWCIYDGPSPEAIRRAAQRNGLPVDRIAEVRVLDPYFLR
jgi:hypothetical protein